MRAIISAAGEASRWGNYKGVRKHLVEVKGERVLDRIVRQLRERGVEDIVIQARPGDEGYEVEGATVYRKRVDAAHQVDRFRPKSIWNTKGRTLILFGDVYFTDEWMDSIVSDTSKEWRFYARLRRFEWEGWSRNRAVFGLSFYPENHRYTWQCIQSLADLQDAGKVHRSIGLDLYRLMCGEPIEILKKIKGNRSFPVHKKRVLLQPDTDASTDFDYPRDYDEFVARMK